MYLLRLNNTTPFSLYSFFKYYSLVLWLLLGTRNCGDTDCARTRCDIRAGARSRVHAPVTRGRSATTTWYTIYRQMPLCRTSARRAFPRRMLASYCVLCLSSFGGGDLPPRHRRGWRLARATGSFCFAAKSGGGFCALSTPFSFSWNAIPGLSAHPPSLSPHHPLSIERERVGDTAPGCTPRCFSVCWATGAGTPSVRLYSPTS